MIAISVTHLLFFILRFKKFLGTNITSISKTTMHYIGSCDDTKNGAFDFLEGILILYLIILSFTRLKSIIIISSHIFNNLFINDPAKK